MEKNSRLFWSIKTLDQLSSDEWDALCDRCGKCCLHKLEDANTREVYFTNVACRLLDLDTGECRDYPNRKTQVPGCLVLEPRMVSALRWLPKTCAYRRLAKKQKLLWWHPLISGSHESVIQAGISVCGRVISEDVVNIQELEKFIVHWMD